MKKSDRAVQSGYHLALLAGILISFTTAANAESVTAGEHIAQTWCRNCHQVGPNVRTANDAVPSFVSIARMPSTTRTSLTVFLSTNHARMPDYALSREEIRDVSAYILSLRKPGP